MKLYAGLLQTKIWVEKNRYKGEHILWFLSCKNAKGKTLIYGYRCQNNVYLSEE